MAASLWYPKTTIFHDWVKDVLLDVKMPGYSFDVIFNDYVSVYIRIRYDEPDVESGAVSTQLGRLWPVTNQNSRDQIVQTCLKAVLTSVEHRVREHFTWLGRAVFQPHQGLDELWEMSPPRAAEAQRPIPFTQGKD